MSDDRGPDQQELLMALTLYVVRMKSMLDLIASE